MFSEKIIINALSSDVTPGHREPCAETNARVGIKFAAQNVIDVSSVVALSYVENHQSYLLHQYQTASIQDRQIQCRKDQKQVSHDEKNMVEKSSTVPNSQYIRST